MCKLRPKGGNKVNITLFAFITKVVVRAGEKHFTIPLQIDM